MRMGDPDAGPVALGTFYVDILCGYLMLKLGYPCWAFGQAARERHICIFDSPQLHIDWHRGGEDMAVDLGEATAIFGFAGVIRLLSTNATFMAVVSKVR